MSITFNIPCSKDPSKRIGVFEFFHVLFQDDSSPFSKKLSLIKPRYFVPQNACTTGTTLPLDWVINVGYSPFDLSFDGGLPLNRNEWEWPPTTKSTSSTSFAIFLSTSYPEWPTAITILTPWSAKLWEFYDYNSLYMVHLKYPYIWLSHFLKNAKLD